MAVWYYPIFPGTSTYKFSVVLNKRPSLFILVRLFAPSLFQYKLYCTFSLWTVAALQHIIVYHKRFSDVILWCKITSFIIMTILLPLAFIMWHNKSELSSFSLSCIVCSKDECLLDWQLDLKSFTFLLILIFIPLLYEPDNIVDVCYKIHMVLNYCAK